MDTICTCNSHTPPTRQHCLYIVFYTPLWLIGPDKLFSNNLPGDNGQNVSTIRPIYMDMIVNIRCPYKIKNDHLSRSDDFCNSFPGLKVPYSRQKCMHLFSHLCVFECVRSTHRTLYMPLFPSHTSKTISVFSKQQITVTQCCNSWRLCFPVTTAIRKCFIPLFQLPDDINLKPK